MIKRNAKILMSALLLLGGSNMAILAKQWTLGECVSYALTNNISLRKTVVNYQSAQETLLQSKADPVAFAGGVDIAQYHLQPVARAW